VVLHRWYRCHVPIFGSRRKYHNSRAHRLWKGSRRPAGADRAARPARAAWSAGTSGGSRARWTKGRSRWSRRSGPTWTARYSRPSGGCWPGGAARSPRNQGGQGGQGRPRKRIRRVDCGTDGCRDGCGADEFAISAFCSANTSPLIDGERNVQRTGQNGSDRPAVLICGKKKQGLGEKNRAQKGLARQQITARYVA